MLFQLRRKRTRHYSRRRPVYTSSRKISGRFEGHVYLDHRLLVCSVCGNSLDRRRPVTFPRGRDQEREADNGRSGCVCLLIYANARASGYVPVITPVSIVR
jgi:hypothetical protein